MITLIKETTKYKSAGGHKLFNPMVAIYIYYINYLFLQLYVNIGTVAG